MTYRIPTGMSRRHFLSHLAGASAMTIPALTLGHSLRTHAAEIKKNRKAAILLWMSGGPSTMDIWDLKPGAATCGVETAIACPLSVLRRPERQQLPVADVVPAAGH